MNKKDEVSVGRIEDAINSYYDRQVKDDNLIEKGMTVRMKALDGFKEEDLKVLGKLEEEYKKEKMSKEDKAKVKAFDRLFSRYKDEKGFFNSGLGEEERHISQFGRTSIQLLRKYESEEGI